MKFDVVIFGSAFVDVYLTSKDFKMVKTSKSDTGVALCEVYGGKIAVEKQVITTGGGATNVAVGLERLGLQTGCVCCVGRDMDGLLVRKELKKEGVSLLYVQQSDKDTSHSTILVGENGGRSALVYRGASNQLSWSKVDWGRLSASWYYVSSLGGDLAMLTKIIRDAHQKKIKVIFNPGSKEIANIDKLKPFLAQVEVLILNLQEAAELTHHDYKNREAVMKDMGKLGVKMVVVTEGRKGANLVRGNEVIRVSAIKVDSVEETGAGDAFGGGFLAGLIKWGKAKKALKLGVANGGAVTEHFGPKEGLLFEPDLAKLKLDQDE